MLKSLRHITHEVNNAKNLATALNTVVRAVCESTNAEACSFFTVDKEHSEYVLTATCGLNQELVNNLRLKLNEGLVGLVGEREELINIADSLAHPKFCHYEENSKELYHAFLGTPIIYQKELLGVLMAQKRQPTKFDNKEEAFLLTLMVQLSELMANSKLNEVVSRLPKTKRSLIFNGVPSVLGIAIGKIAISYPTANLDAVPNKQIDDHDKQITIFTNALQAAHNNILALQESISSQVSEEDRILFDAYSQLLLSPSLKNDVVTEIQGGNWAPGALKQVITKRVSQFEAMEDSYLRERALDLKDLGHRILFHLQTNDYAPPAYPKNTILVGEEITPSMIAEVPEGHLTGIVSVKGSHHSHMAILARALGIPTIMRTDNLPLAHLENKEAIIDGYYGQLYVSPTKDTRQEFISLSKQEQELNAELMELVDVPATTTDKHNIAMLINTGLSFDFQHSLHAGAEGVGLYRTELPFMTRDYFPAEEEQMAIYKNLLKTFAPHPVVMRTLDIGGDKTLSYLNVKEPNPYLGWRGIRFTLDHPEIFLIQVRAMLRASIEYDNLRIMLPMISSIPEIEKAKLLIKQAHTEIAADNPKLKMPLIGAMIEVPSALYQAQSIAQHMDFLSVGSNDLTQYLLAVDRNNMKVANLYDSLHPAVLSALSQVVAAAHKEKKPISICGEMAGDPLAVLLLLAIGFDSLSMNSNQLLKMKWLIRKFSMKQAKKLLAEVMQMDDATEIRYHMEAALEEAGAAGLIRAGK